MVATSEAISSLSAGVVIIVASAFFSLTSPSASVILASVVLSVWLNNMHPAFEIWSLKNSPKFLIYILHLFTSTTTTELLRTVFSISALSTALVTSLSLPTPEGSMRIRSGMYSAITFRNASLKSPTKEQHIQPEFISEISIPASLRNPPSIPISPNSFSIRTIFSPLYASCINLFISVVFPAPRNPEIISIFVTKITSNQ